MCWAQKELWSLCEYTAWEFSSLGSYRAETQVFLCHQNMQNTRCTAHLVIKDPCSNEQKAALQLQKQRILPVCTDAKSAELSILQDLVKNSTILGWRELVWTGSSILRHRFPGGGVGTPRGHSIITTLADLPYYSNCFEFSRLSNLPLSKARQGAKVFWDSSKAEDVWLCRSCLFAVCWEWKTQSLAVWDQRWMVSRSRQTLFLKHLYKGANLVQRGAHTDIH